MIIFKYFIDSNEVRTYPNLDSFPEDVFYNGAVTVDILILYRSYCIYIQDSILAFCINALGELRELNSNPDYVGGMVNMDGKYGLRFHRQGTDLVIKHDGVFKVYPFQEFYEGLKKFIKKVLSDLEVYYPNIVFSSGYQNIKLRLNIWINQK